MSGYEVTGRKRALAHYPLAVLIARIYEVFPLLCPICGGQMHIIAFIKAPAHISRTRAAVVGGLWECADG